MNDAQSLWHFNPDKPVTLPGVKCAYCGRELNRSNRTRDHVIGRKFVPEGSIGNGFNLIVQACRDCNDRKASLEDDISLITMLPDTAGRYARDDERLRKTVARKARGSISPATRRLAAESYAKINWKCPIGQGVSLKYEGVAMPLLDEQRVARLAYYHVQAFAFFRSFNRIIAHGAWLEPSRFLMIGYLTKDDWGNPHLRHFMAVTCEWELVGIVAAADGYFRHMMRKHQATDCWAWAVEWNERLRVFGIYGEESARDSFMQGISPLQPDFAYGDTTNGFAMRWDTPLADEDDVLFGFPASAIDQDFASPHWR